MEQTALKLAQWHVGSSRKNNKSIIDLCSQKCRRDRNIGIERVSERDGAKENEAKKNCVLA